MVTHKLLFEQGMERIQTEILLGKYRPDDRIISTTEIAGAMSINLATACKGVQMLVRQGILYKKLGIGMMVTHEARGGVIFAATPR